MSYRGCFVCKRKEIGQLGGSDIKRARETWVLFGGGDCLSNLTDYVICQPLRGCVSLPGQKNPEWLEGLHDDTGKRRKQKTTSTYSLTSPRHALNLRGERPSDFRCAVREVSLMLKPRLRSLSWTSMAGWAVQPEGEME